MQGSLNSTEEWEENTRGKRNLQTHQSDLDDRESCEQEGRENVPEAGQDVSWQVNLHANIGSLGG